ncbi:MAG TPA: type II toxin-antitoxin system RelE/ParE family toxin [Polyangiaceae bacterium]|nr:type II toxin-antitoxin system RelE/ParE family toxin [Polyangiaceae bacterium]
MKLDFTLRALGEIERAKRNWLARRDKNPALFELELAAVVETIKTVPALGSPSGMSRGRLVRRLPMIETQYTVYYRQDAPDQVYVLRVWGGRRGMQPQFR